MNLVRRKTIFAGLLLLGGVFAGLFSVSPAIDSTKYLTECAANSNQVIIAAIFQFVMSLAYVGIAILLYPIIKRFSGSLSIGFLSFEIMATTLVIVGTLLLLSILGLSQEFVKNPSQDILALEALGNVLKSTRDYINHVFMILVLCAGNFMFYTLLLKSKLVPSWLSIWGLLGNLLSAIASILILFQVMEIITAEYLALNVPTVIHELVLGVWLIVKGFDNGLLETNNCQIKS